jgi:hypothetical protein
MKFYPPKNMEIDYLKDNDYLENIIAVWEDGLNLVTCFDISKGKIYHTFMNVESIDFHSGILRVWTKDSINKIITAIKPKSNKNNTTIYDKIDILDRVFNRNGKLYNELNSDEKLSAYETMLSNAKNYLHHKEYIMSAYYLKGALLYKKTKEVVFLLEECRKKVVNNSNKAA